MKSLYNTSDLVQYGINPLTGEACAYSMRVLCDLSEAGTDLLCDCFGLPRGSTVFAKNWNSMVGDSPAIASFMLPRDTIKSLMLFALFHVDRFDYVIEAPSNVLMGFMVDEEYGAQHLELAQSEDYHSRGYRLHRNYTKASTAQVGGRNIHAMSGRTI